MRQFLKKLDHIGIAVQDLDSATEIYQAITNKKPTHKEIVASQKVETTIFEIGDSRIELLNGTDPDSPISKFIEKRGAGIHHICFEVNNLTKAKKEIEKTGLKFIEEVSSEGVGGTKVAFLHPKSTGGVLIELVEYTKS